MRKKRIKSKCGSTSNALLVEESMSNIQDLIEARFSAKNLPNF
jgi:hypothetical protein